MKKTLFISDLHLDADHPASMQIFTRFINNLDNNVEALYILGDFFEVWIGDDDNSPFHTQMIDLLASLRSKNIPVYFLVGNRDFLLGKKFFAAAHCTLLPDETLITLYQMPVLLMHGDTLCTQDIHYQRARKIFRNRFLQFFFLHLPLSWRRKIADKMRNASKQHTQTTPAYIMDVTQEEVERVMQKHQVTTLIHGHTHRPGIHQFPERIVLGAWHDQGNVLVWYEDGRKELVTLKSSP